MSYIFNVIDKVIKLDMSIITINLYTIITVLPFRRAAHEDSQIAANVKLGFKFEVFLIKQIAHGLKPTKMTVLHMFLEFAIFNF